MREVICWVNLPFIMRPVVRCLENSISSQIPHLRVGIIKVLLHTEVGFLWFILAVLHVFEFCQGLFNWTIPVYARSRLAALLSSVDFNFFLCAGRSQLDYIPWH